MATIEICDVCGTRKNVHRQEYVTGTKNNGIDYDNVSEIIDLCETCELRILKTAITELIITRETGVVSESRWKLNSVFIKHFNDVVKVLKV